MKKFITNSIVFLLLLFTLSSLLGFVLIWTGKYKHTVAGSETYYSIIKSKEKKKTKKLLLGDSVGNQLFPNTSTNATINSLSCNQAIGIIGHYLLLNNYLNAGNQVDTVYMVFRPYSFQNNLNQVFTYHYFLKPFYTEEYKALFTPLVIKQIKKIPYSKFCRVPQILTSNWAPDFSSTDSISYTFLSPISVEYLHKIKELSIKHHFKIRILSPPMSLIHKSNVEKMDKNEPAKNNLGQEFEHYFENIIYLNDSHFLDGSHLNKVSLAFYTNHYKSRFFRK